MKFFTPITLLGLLQFQVALAASEIPLPTPPAVTAKEIILRKKPVIPERQTTIYALAKRQPLILRDFPSSYVDHTVDVIARLQRAAKNVRSVELWSLDPAVRVDEKEITKAPSVHFHQNHPLGHKELKDDETIQRLILAVALSIANGPEETEECFDPRHGLRIHEQNAEIDLVICYTCHQGVLYEGKDEMWFATTNEAEKEFDALFTKLGLKKAD